MKVFLVFIALFLVSSLTAKDPSIPVLHVEDYMHEKTRESFLQAFELAVTQTGYFFITENSLDSQTIMSTYAESKAFFASEEKAKYHSKNGLRGYCEGESAKDETRMDYKEFFHIGRELSKKDLERLQYEENIWPKEPKDFRQIIQPLYSRIDAFKNILGEAFSELLDQKKAFIREMILEGDSVLRLVHYPAHPPENAIWAGAHTDINLFTIYPRATARGLQVQAADGSWIDVNIPEGMVFVHCGDMLENLSNGFCKATVHRVVDNGEDLDRYSLVFFVHPRSDDRLDPLPSCIEKTGGKRLYANLSRIELLAERLIDLGLADKKLKEVFVRSGAIQKLKEVGRFSPKAETALIEEGWISSQLELQ